MAGEVPQSVKVALRSTLLSRQGGIKQTQLEKEYHALNNTRLCVKVYGFNDLYEFLLALPDVVRLEYSEKDGENKVFGVGDKNVFMSNHAKKAQGIPNGKPPLPPAEWPRNKSKATKERKVGPDNCSLKVTLLNGNENIQISPDKRGLYAIHVSGLPINCTQDDMSKVFKRFSSMREVKMEGASNNRMSFVRFSQRSDAIKALKENDGYILHGMKIRVRPANNGKACKNNNLPKSPGKKSKSTDFRSNPGTSVESLGNCTDTFSTNNNWEVNRLCPLPGKEVSGSGPPLTEEKFVLEENGLYPIHVSNFPRGTTKETLFKEFSRCGDIERVVKSNERFAFIFYKHREGAILALRTMKALKLGDKVLTVTPKVSNYKNLEQMNAILLPAEAAKLPLNLSSSHSSISSCESSSPKTSAPPDTPDTGYGSGGSTDGSSHTISAHEALDKGSRVSVTISNRLTIPEENAKKTRTFTAVAAVCPEPLHTLLSHAEMCELMQRCGKKTLVTSNNIAPQEEEFDILVTEIVDSCHFWANVDDKIGSYKRLRKLSADLQTVEHYKCCMPLKYDLGAAVFSEDNLWYRCWCLEVSRIEDHQVKVFFVDYGNSEWTSWDKFTDIPERFWELAPQAVPFKLAGLEPMSDRESEVSKEGAKYLSDLICNRVCRARRTLTSKSQAESRIIEVELLLKDANSSSVNKQMGLTRYVREAKAEISTTPPYQPGPYHLAVQVSPSTSQQPLKDQQWMPEKPPEKSQVSNSQPNTTSCPNDADTKSSVITQQSSVASGRKVLNDQSVTVQKQLPQWQSSKAKSAPQPKQKLPENQQDSSSDENPQAQQSLPYQLFEKREVLNVKLSCVDSPDELHFIKTDETTCETLNHIKRLLERDVDTSAKIYPKKGDVVVKLLNGGKKVRAKIESVPRSNSPGIDKVFVYFVDDGIYEYVSLKTLCELPSSLKDVPFLAMQCKLAGIKRKLLFWPDLAIDPLFQLKRGHEVIQMSVIGKQKNGVWLVELFDPYGKSLNVQLIENGYALRDEQQCSVMPSSTTAVTSNISNTTSSDSVKFPDNVSTANQKHWWHRSLGSVSDGHHSDKQSIHSDWEESIQEDWDEEVVRTATPLTHSLNTETAEQSEEKLYMPPPPVVQQLSTGTNDNGVIDPLVNGTSVRLTEPVLTNGGLQQNRNEPYCSKETACQPRIEFDELETKNVNFTSEESASWKVEREELLHREGELQRILGKSHEEVIRMIHLKKEKEKLERKIRIKEMENQILRLQKELKQLESTKIKLEEDLK